MAFKTFTVGEVLTASDVNTYLAKQAVIVCTSGTRPTAAEGMTIYETDTDLLKTYNGTAWVTSSQVAGPTSYTPTWSATGTAPSLGDGTLVGRYQQVGQQVWFLIRLIWGSTTTGGTGTWQFTLPIAPNLSNLGMNASALDASAGFIYPAVARAGSVSPEIDRIGAHTSTGAIGLVTATHPFTWAVSDALSIQGLYHLV